MGFSRGLVTESLAGRMKVRRQATRTPWPQGMAKNQQLRELWTRRAEFPEPMAYCRPPQAEFDSRVLGRYWQCFSVFRSR
jgi:hypothetical protein